MENKITERTMLDALNIRYGSNLSDSPLGHRYTRAEHVRSSLGYNASRSLDFVAVDTWGTNYGSEESRGPYLHGHEIKISRSDWLTELRDPTKAEEFKQYMHYFWLVVADKTIIKEGELPEGWGLLVRRGAFFRVQVPAPRLVPKPMSLDQHGALLKATQTTQARIGRSKLSGESNSVEETEA
jgi:hypothetical protein